MEQKPGEQRVNLQQLLKVMVENGASDLHITVNSPPQYRINGHLVPLKIAPMTHMETQRLAYSILNDAQKHRFEEEKELDLSFSIKGLSRFRANLFIQRGSIACAIRVIPAEIKSFRDLNLPPVLSELADRPRGLVLVTGPTGSGKSTTLAAMIDKINTETPKHILTIEDPIEFVHNHKMSLVNQREINSDTFSYEKALKYILRQDPDVVLIGEIRDRETIEAALAISETGHLCLATLHTNSAIQTITRIVDMFPADRHEQIRSQLSFVLEGIVTQLLIPKKDGKGRIAATEILLPNTAIRHQIRENKLQQVYSSMQTGQKVSGMNTLNQALFNLYKEGIISLEESLNKSYDVLELKTMLKTKLGIVFHELENN
ncbi:type IV pilus twitching motility protein PilT [bacterium]|nr:type IV pilus twitching motility protein PilT [bacterium]